MGEGEDDGSAIFIANSGANFIAVIGKYLEIKYESLPSLTRNTIRVDGGTTSIFQVVDERGHKPTLLLVLWPIRRGWIGGNEIDGAQFVNGEFIGGEKWKRDTIVRNR